jgi:hypothetical protein
MTPILDPATIHRILEHLGVRADPLLKQSGLPGAVTPRGPWITACGRSLSRAETAQIAPDGAAVTASSAESSVGSGAAQPP